MSTPVKKVSAGAMRKMKTMKKQVQSMKKMVKTMKTKMRTMKKRGGNAMHAMKK